MLNPARHALRGPNGTAATPYRAILVLIGVLVTTVGGAQGLSTQRTTERFTIDVPDAVLGDLRERLARTRWPDQLSGTGWTYGTDTAYLRELVSYWGNGFDWRAQEARLNEFEHYRAQVGGMRIHFVHARSKDAYAIPLLLLHG